MATTYGSKPNSALSFAVERDNLLQCYDAFESTGSGHWPDVAEASPDSGSAKSSGNPQLNITDGFSRENKIYYHTLDGSGDYFLFEQIAQPSTASLSTWIRIDDTNTLETLCSHVSGGPVSTYYAIETTGYMLFGYYDGTWRSITGTGSVVDDNVWHHCVWARNNTNHRFYVDGSLDTNLTMNSAMGGAINTIGSKWSEGSQFTGDIAHFSMYSVQLSATQVSNMYEHQRHRFGV